MDDFGNDIWGYSTDSDYEQWLISTSAYGGFSLGSWSRSERAEI
jgi:hypothetical protein